MLEKAPALVAVMLAWSAQGQHVVPSPALPTGQGPQVKALPSAEVSFAAGTSKHCTFRAHGELELTWKGWLEHPSVSTQDVAPVPEYPRLHAPANKP